MRFSLRCAYVHGVSAIRTHLDHRLNNHPEISWRVYQILKQEWQDKIELQAVGLTSVALFSSDQGLPYVKLVAENGSILGAVTDGLGVRPGLEAGIDSFLDKYFETAGEYGLDTDLHADQVPNAFCLPNIAKSVLRTGYKGKVVVDHCVSLALQPESVVNETLELCKVAQIAFVSLPTPMLYLQDRVKGKTPRWRGVTLLNEIRAAGLPIGLGTDNCRDFWYPYGDHDMVDIFRQAVRIYHLDHPLEDAPAHVGPIPADIMGLNGVGRIEPGSPAHLILFRARNLNEILSRPQSDRVVLHRGKVIEETLPDYSELDSQ
jgi:cytosine deaminase